MWGLVSPGRGCYLPQMAKWGCSLGASPILVLLPTYSLMRPEGQVPSVLLAQGSKGLGFRGGCSCPHPSLCCGARAELSGPCRPRAAYQDQGLWVAPDRALCGCRPQGYKGRWALGKGSCPGECCPLHGYPRTSWGTEHACVLAAPREDPSGDLGDGRLHIWQGWTAPWKGRVKKHRGLGVTC